MAVKTGIVYVRRNGIQQRVAGSVSINPGIAKREALPGHTQVEGYKELPQVPFIECEIFEAVDLNVIEMLQGTAETVSAELNDGKVFVGRDGWFAGDGTLTSEEGRITCRWEFPAQLEEVA